MRDSLFRDRLLLGLLVLVAWLPLGTGGRELFFWGITDFSIGLLLLTWLYQYARDRRCLPEAARRAWPALLLLALWLLYLFLQILPLPPELVVALSPKAAWAHGLTYRPPGESSWLTLSVDPYRTRLALHRSLSLVLLFLLVLLLVRRFTYLRWVGIAMVFGGTLCAALALGGYLAGWEAMYRHGNSLTATFANRNHFANYLAMAVAVGIGLLLAQMGGGNRPRERREILRRALDWIMSGKMRLRAYLLLMTAALILTRSRMGNTAFFASLLLAGVVALLLMRRKSRGMVVLLAGLVVIDIFLVGSAIGIDHVVERLEKTSFTHESRDEVMRDTISYWRDFPLTGSGLGTFGVTFPLYKGADILLTYQRAHNDYLQFAAETGGIGLVLIGGFVSLSLGAALLTLRRRRLSWALGAAFGLFMSTVALLIHSTVEFNLQTFANAATYMVVAAMGWVALHLPAERKESSCTARRRIVLAATAGLFVVLHLAASGALVAADLIGNHNETLLTRWKGQEKLSHAPVEAALERQRLAMRLAPGSAEAKLVAVRLMAADQRAWPHLTPRQKLEMADRMLVLLLDATRSSPLLPTPWLAIAHVRHFQRNYDALFLAALVRAGQLAPWEFRVQLDLARVGLAAWYRLSPSARRLVLDAVRRGMTQKPGEMAELVKKLGRQQPVCRHLRGISSRSLCPP